MKVLFCHDGPLIKDELNNFYGVAHNSEMFKRYFAIGDKLEVLIRVRNLKKEELKKYSKINIPSITIKECPNISSLKGIFFKKNKFIKLINQTVLN